LFRAAHPAKTRDPLIIDYGTILFFVGVVICFFGLAMLLPAAIDIADRNEDYRVFLTSCGVLLFMGSAVALSFRRERHAMGIREVMLTAPLTWVIVVAFSALPFVFSTLQLSYTDAVFETMSGITATGSTVITNLDAQPRGILLWRWLLIWFGGFGVITVAVFVLPFLRIGGMQMFVLDLSAQAGGKFVPRMLDVVSKIGLIYVGLTLGCTIGFWSTGMTPFDAIGHAMAAIATGGFSSHDAGLGYYNSAAIESVATAFMLLAAMPFIVHIEALSRGPQVLWRDDQVRLFLFIISTSVLALTLWLVETRGFSVLESLRYASFNLVSQISTTGFTSTYQDWATWGGFCNVQMLLAMLVGGCTGSTAGGIKMFRLCILLQSLRAQMHRQVYPHGTFVVTYNDAAVADLVRAGVSGYFYTYLSTFFMFALALGFTGLPFEAALGASATALGGVGPGLGPVIGPAGTFASLSPAAKWLLIVEMLAGRLEILVLIVPVTRMFWRS
jgi:trk system potassium uptake protein TrkH